MGTQDRKREMLGGLAGGREARHGRGAHCAVVVAVTLGLLAMNASGALAFNPPPNPGAQRVAYVSAHLGRSGGLATMARGSWTTLPAGLRAALVHLGLGARGRRPFAVRPSCKCGGGPSSQQTELTPFDGPSQERFGFSVALSAKGTIALIGAPDAYAAGEAYQPGAAYVFVRSGSSWLPVQKLTPSDGRDGTQFGAAVALSSDGSTVLIGAPAPVLGGPGAAYVFAAAPYLGYFQQAKLTATNDVPERLDGFGTSVALSSDGSTALIGAPYNWVRTGDFLTDAGAAYAFVRNGSTWSQQAELVAHDRAIQEDFGLSVALSGDGATALIGDPLKVVNYPGAPLVETGAAYVFVHSGTAWSEQSRLTPSDGVANDRFGTSVALNSDGTTALIGAPARNRATGAAYVFVAFFGWNQLAELTASHGASNDSFGNSVALDSTGHTALIGAPYHYLGSGAAYVFHGSWSNWMQKQALFAADSASNDNFGISVALSGNGATRLVGAPYHNYSGAAYDI
jgi:hypothetical protein